MNHLIATTFAGCLLTAMAAFSQPLVSISHYEGCAGHESVISLDVKNFTDIAAFSIFIGVDTSAIAFVSIGNSYQALAAGSLVSHFNVTGQVSLNISWYGPAVNIDNGKLLDINVVYKKDATPFHFLENCEIARSDFNVIPDVGYTDGSLAAIGNYSPEPALATVIEGNNATFVIPEVAGVSYQWQEKERDYWIDLSEGDIVQGVNSPRLDILSVQETLNNRQYRCIISYKDCSKSSAEALLLVTPSGLNETNGPQPSLLRVYPNPAGDKLTYYIYSMLQHATLRLMDVNGNTVLLSDICNAVPGEQRVIPLDGFPPGVYLLQLTEKSQTLTTARFIRKL